ncbi:MAG: nitrite reductase small subunit NirD [Zoogloeaceae bacterium]|nr:nitrite reductase small subunit NirD [Zoogloeaceae bacterium]MCP5239792.1 nitrite reductase small subunit NirD [Zoogloeaceae bacterium]MCP5253971.1 nitrite reductase small subunit NirD [Zoogloeaceae bacterium]MCP5293637.1 nitrite reductase small subunit NirD [Zoogloeaceae bacterium]
MDTTTEMQTTWKQLCALEEIPVLGSRVVKGTKHGDIAVFRTSDDDVFAIHDKCPHKGGPLSQGIVHGRSVSCPLHNWKIRLEDGNAEAPDVGCSRSFAAKVENGTVFLQL